MCKLYYIVPLCSKLYFPFWGSFGGKIFLPCLPCVSRHFSNFSCLTTVRLSA